MLKCPYCDADIKCEVEEFHTEEITCGNCCQVILVTMVDDVYRVVKKCQDHKLTLMVNKSNNEFTLICSECYHVYSGIFDKLIEYGEEEQWNN